MTLPKKPFLPRFQNKTWEAIALPAGFIVLLLIVILLGIFLPKLTKKPGSNNSEKLNYYTKPTAIKVNGKNQGVPARVRQISPKSLYEAILNKEDLQLVQIIKDDEWKKPHIKGSIFVVGKSLSKSTYGLDPAIKHVFISDDGLDSAVAIDTLITYGFSRETNLNLEGGLDAWEKGGYPLEK